MSGCIKCLNPDTWLPWVRSAILFLTYALQFGVQLWIHLWPHLHAFDTVHIQFNQVVLSCPFPTTWDVLMPISRVVLNMILVVSSYECFFRNIDVGTTCFMKAIIFAAPHAMLRYSGCLASWFGEWKTRSVELVNIVLFGGIGFAINVVVHDTSPFNMAIYRFTLLILMTTVYLFGLSVDFPSFVQRIAVNVKKPLPFAWWISYMFEKDETIQFITTYPILVYIPIFVLLNFLWFNICETRLMLAIITDGMYTTFTTLAKRYCGSNVTAFEFLSDWGINIFRRCVERRREL